MAKSRFLPMRKVKVQVRPEHPNYRLTYYHPNGKKHKEIEVAWVRPKTFQDCVKKVRGSWHNGGHGSLPGITGEWDQTGYIVLRDYESGESHLILP